MCPSRSAMTRLFVRFILHEPDSDRQSPVLQSLVVIRIHSRSEMFDVVGRQVEFQCSRVPRGSNFDESGRRVIAKLVNRVVDANESQTFVLFVFAIAHHKSQCAAVGDFVMGDPPPVEQFSVEFHAIDEHVIRGIIVGDDFQIMVSEFDNCTFPEWRAELIAVGADDRVKTKRTEDIPCGTVCRRHRFHQVHPGQSRVYVQESSGPTFESSPDDRRH